MLGAVLLPERRSADVAWNGTRRAVIVSAGCQESIAMTTKANIALAELAEKLRIWCAS